MDSEDSLISQVRELCETKVYRRDLIHALPDSVKDRFIEKIRSVIKRGLAHPLKYTEKARRVYNFLTQYKVSSNMFSRGTVTITFGDVAENHVGNQQIGVMSEVGFTVEDLQAIQNRMIERYGAITSLINLNEESGSDVIRGGGEQASVLVIRNAVDLFLGNKLYQDDKSVYQELVNLNWDKKFYDARRKKVLNKQARWNIIISNEKQEPDYEQGKGRIVAWNNVPRLRSVFDAMKDVVGSKADDLHAEGNYYHAPSVTGIGWHGDSERKKVIALRFGHTIPLAYQWYNNGAPIGDKITLSINNGDMYIMSQKATGFDWSFRQYKTIHLRHSAGCPKYTNTKVKKPSKK